MFIHEKLGLLGLITIIRVVMVIRAIWMMKVIWLGLLGLLRLLGLLGLLPEHIHPRKMSGPPVNKTGILEPQLKNSNFELRVVRIITDGY